MSNLANVDVPKAVSAAVPAVGVLASGTARPGASEAAAVGLPVTNVAPASGGGASSASAEAVQAAAAQLDSYMRDSQRSIVFEVDKSTGQIVVSVQDAATGKTIRQIPSEVVLALAQELDQNKSIDSLQFDAKA